MFFIQLNLPLIKKENTNTLQIINQTELNTKFITMLKTRSMLTESE